MSQNIETSTVHNTDTKDIADTALSSEPVLEVEDLTKKFGGLTAVDDLSFRVFEEEILGFIGPNGAGKSTTFNCITGTYPPTAGTIRYRGDDITGLPTYDLVRRGIARTFQTHRPLRDRNVLDNVVLALTPSRIFSVPSLRGETEKRATKICENIGLGDRLYQMPDNLPHAGLLKLELARALATDPDVLLLDEPFAGLTSAEIETISELLVQRRETGLTLVVVDHNMRGLLSLIDRAIVISFGQKIAEGSPEAIRNNKEVQEAYLGGEQ